MASESIELPKAESGAIAKLLLNRFETIASTRSLMNPPEPSIVNALETLCFGNGLGVEALSLVWSHVARMLKAYSELFAVSWLTSNRLMKVLEEI